MTNWATTKASNFCFSVRDGTHDSPKRVNVGKYLITSRHIIGGGIDLANAYLISNSDYDEVNRRSKVDRWDVLFTMIGTVGEVCLVKDEPNFAIKNIGLFKSKNELDGKWLYYFLQSKKTKQLLDSLKRGTTQSYIPLGELRNLNILYPTNISEAQNIVSVLSALDDKIENNRLMNETLEEMARTIFKSWFVDFDPVHAKAAGNAPAHMDADTAALFPSSFGDDGLPKGWQIKQIEEVAEQVAMGPFGSNIKVSTFVDTGIPIISGKHLNEILLEDKDYNFITEEHANTLLRSNVYREDIVFTHAGNVGQVSIIPETSKYERYVLSQRGFYLRCDKSKVSSKYLVHFFKSHLGQHLLLANVSSTGVPSIARPSSYLKSIKFCLPSMPVLNAFDELAISLHLKVSANKNENKTLAELRDTLLPKLMSGEIRVKDAEQEVEVAV